ncbi:MAG: nitrilase-related carbon-nitrogen hydrolase [Acidimicrobiia bacterium]
MKIAAIQHDVVWEDAKATCARLAPMIAGAAGAGARLVVLTEMFSTGFSMNTAAIAEAPDGPSVTFLRQQAAAHGIWLCASVPVLVPGHTKPFNRLTLATPEGDAHSYDKIHPFTYSGEHEHYDAGTSFLTVDVEGLRCSFFVCYDLRFANEFWELAPSTDCYVLPANWPESRRLHWQSLLQARAIENQAYVVGVNRVGQGGKLHYVGDSRIIDPLGELLTTGARAETTLIADIDPAMVAATRERFPFMNDRRS